MAIIKLLLSCKERLLESLSNITQSAVDMASAGSYTISLKKEYAQLILNLEEVNKNLEHYLPQSEVGSAGNNEWLQSSLMFTDDITDNAFKCFQNNLSLTLEHNVFDSPATTLDNLSRTKTQIRGFMKILVLSEAIINLTKEAIVSTSELGLSYSDKLQSLQSCLRSALDTCEISDQNNSSFQEVKQLVSQLL